MTNATVRANAQALPETTDRRAVLGAVLAAGALGATAALPAYAAPAAAALSPTDRRVLDLWNRRNRMRAALSRFSDERDAAEAELPDWARSGPRYVLAKGEIFVPGVDDVVETAYWPEVADLDQQPVSTGRILARPNADDLSDQFGKDRLAGPVDAARKKLTQRLIALDKRLEQQKAEHERTGYARLNSKSERGWGHAVALDAVIEKYTEGSVLALGARLMIGIQDNLDEDNVLAAYRVSLRAIRPQLVGGIAEDADRVLAENEEAE
jgi:hypothetical protein